MTKNISQRLSTKLAFGTTLIAAMLSGCASKIDTEQHQQLIENFIAEAQIAPELSGQSEVNWWQQLQSPQLNQLISQSLANNYDLRSSQLLLESALARLGAQKAKYLPQGGVTIDSQRTNLTTPYQRQSSAAIGFDWQVDLFGRISALVNAANASAMSQAEQLRALQIEVVSAVVKGYISYQGNLKKQQIIEMQIDALKQSIEVLAAQVEEGMANELDLNRTRAQLNQQQALLPEISYAQYRDSSMLALLTGRLVNDLSLPDEQQILAQPFAVALAQPDHAIALRPDISRALFEFSQANSLSVAAAKALYPNISLSAFTGVLSLGNNQLKDSQHQWQVAPQIEWSLLSYPALLAQRDAQQLLSEAAYNHYQQAVLKAMSDSELSLQSLDKQVKQKYYAERRYLHANKAFSQANAMYQEGQIPYLELLDARRDVLIAQENAVDSTISSLIAKVSAYQAFNGRWSSALTTL
ncbi:RND transporter [Thalassotalea insulae]|uniref:RND transporter n=1 Tax=Thalassotalea insulae TaxID=2056778 RepID=A0ABQ6GRV8_9GAMM|nr:TolC family protein [Thalassotalea insulae]GLX78671.1 RND transporter [Thalassotalea insulae]